MRENPGCMEIGYNHVYELVYSNDVGLLFPRTYDESLSYGQPTKRNSGCMDGDPTDP